MARAGSEVRSGGWRGLAPVPPMSETQFARWVELVRRRTGMQLAPERKSFLVTSLAARMRELGCEDYDAYYALLTEGPRGAVEWALLVDRLTVHETRFFRHRPSFALIRERLLPQAPVPEALQPYRLQVWSIGCATGEEAYSLAIAIDEHLGRLGGRYYFGITATDISLSALATARRGRYPGKRLDRVSPDQRARYFRRVAPDTWEVVPGLRKRVCFAQLNVLELARAPLAPMDLIFCQNVLIYFDRAQREAVLAEVVRRLAPGGMLVLGPGELVGWRHPELERVHYPDTLAFRRVARAGGGAA